MRERQQRYLGHGAHPAWLLVWGVMCLWLSGCRTPPPMWEPRGLTLGPEAMSQVVGLPAAAVGDDDHGAPVAMAFSPDGRTLAVSLGAAPATIQLVDIPTRSLRATLSSEVGPLVHLAFAPFEPVLTSAMAAPAIVTDDSTGHGVRVFQTQEAILLHALPGHGPTAISSNGRSVAALVPARTQPEHRAQVDVWDLQTGRLLQRQFLEASDELPAMTPEGWWLMCPARRHLLRIDGSTMLVYRVGIPGQPRVITHERSVLRAAFNHHGHILAFTTAADSSTGQPATHLRSLNIITLDTGPVITSNVPEAQQVFVSDDGLILGLADEMTVELWNRGTGRRLLRIDMPQGSTIALATLSPDHRTLAIATPDGRVLLYHLPDHQP